MFSSFVAKDAQRIYCEAKERTHQMPGSGAMPANMA